MRLALCISGMGSSQDSSGHQPQSLPGALCPAHSPPRGDRREQRHSGGRGRERSWLLVKTRLKSSVCVPGLEHCLTKSLSLEASRKRTGEHSWCLGGWPDLGTGHLEAWWGPSVEGRVHSFRAAGGPPYHVTSNSSLSGLPRDLRF
ncbi:hypothetical protein H1C71_042566 [Ictidomys tridecemlineatus]|nr:hypothetical protein H1C71_042566 [Ictidomys tridecemlineatus]KAG3284252.1 hypothetical protein H1C71_042566 [Ictidomys tridecemlineatus]KAG3284253.1 hypothetical protein H1C71_042566 [Ictidomys tridecemlineatus]KAG3284254.1 hypothetical protein H1C71_042566 [Ictidomys tridecemlineatus]